MSRRRPVVMATVTPATCDEATLTQWRRAGMKAVRINSAHADGDMLRRMVTVIRGVDPSIAILMDTKGPEVRTTECAEPITMQTGQRVRLADTPDRPTAPRIISVNVAGLLRHLQPGMEVAFDDGEIRAIVHETSDTDCTLEVTQGGVLGSRKTVNIPALDLTMLPAVSERDRRALQAGLEAGIDMVAHSFVRDSADIAAVRSILADSPIELIAKIECGSAVRHLDEIARAADGLLVARGDLGVEIGYENVPSVQRRALRICTSMSKRAMVATQFLQSMTTHTQPTRAEIEGIYSTLEQGADTLLLCGETATGQHPTECIRQMRRVMDTYESDHGTSV